MGQAMKSVLFLVIATISVLASAEAAPFCASPSELKLLKAAMLEQALTSAAQSCHQSAEFGRFVAAYHTGMVASDRALKAFFARRKTGETYDAYKARIAEDLSARSLHDTAFCAEAARVFDIALKHKHAVPPKLIATGYEHCGKPGLRAPVAMPVMARAELALRPVKRASDPVPVPALSPAARKALALASRTPPTTAPTTPTATPPQPHPALRQEPPVKLAMPVPPAPPAPVRSASAQPLFVHAKSVAAAVSESGDEDMPYDPIPNAYKPGAYWVDQARETERYAPPRGRQPLVQGPDGRWYVVIDHHDHWTND
jgi:hypothetical protein